MTAIAHSVPDPREARPPVRGVDGSGAVSGYGSGRSGWGVELAVAGRAHKAAHASWSRDDGVRSYPGSGSGPCRILRVVVGGFDRQDGSAVRDRVPR